MPACRCRRHPPRISINAGQARLRDIVMRTDGADLQAAVNVDLGDAMLDALLTLNAPPQAAGAAPPALMVALKGALPAPKRTVDTTLLTSWLTLRELEQQSRQLEAMEKAAREVGGRRRRRASEARRTRAAIGCPGERADRAGAEGDRWNFRRRASAGAAAADHDPGGAEAARRAPDRQSRLRPARPRSPQAGRSPGLFGAQN